MNHITCNYGNSIQDKEEFVVLDKRKIEKDKD